MRHAAHSGALNNARPFGAYSIQSLPTPINPMNGSFITLGPLLVRQVLPLRLAMPRSFVYVVRHSFYFR